MKHATTALALCLAAPAKSLPELRARAEQGDASAQNTLGMGYLNGDRVAQDDAQAVLWFRKAAEQGNAIAQRYLGDMYENGHGVAQDHAQAMLWYRKAARNHLYRLGVQ